MATRPTTRAGVSARIAEINAPTTTEEWKAITQVMQWIAVVTAVGGILVLLYLLTYPTRAEQAGEASVV